MPFPSNQTRDSIAWLHAGVLVDPMLGLRTNPIGSTRHGTRAVGTDQFVRIWTLVNQCAHSTELTCSTRWAEHPNSSNRTSAFIPQDLAAYCVTREESYVCSTCNRLLHVSKHIYCPILVVPNTEKSFATRCMARVAM